MAAETPVCDFGLKAVDFSLKGTDGKTYTLTDVAGPKGTLVIFMCNHCPYVRAVIDRILRDCRELKQHGIGAIAVMPNDTEAFPDDSFENMKRWAEELDFPFPYVIDETQEVARAYDAVCTPDFFGFNAELKLQYRGRLDESRNQPAAPDARRELYEAMLQIAETGNGPEQQLPSMGCTIKWREAA